jgi:hypothetical protein
MQEGLMKAVGDLTGSIGELIADSTIGSGGAAVDGLDGLIDALVADQHVMEMFRRSPTTNARKRLLRLSIRLIKILAEIKSSRATE